MRRKLQERKRERQGFTRSLERRGRGEHRDTWKQTCNEEKRYKTKERHLGEEEKERKREKTWP